MKLRWISGKSNPVRVALPLSTREAASIQEMLLLGDRGVEEMLLLGDRGMEEMLLLGDRGMEEMLLLGDRWMEEMLLLYTDTFTASAAHYPLPSLVTLSIPQYDHSSSLSF